MYKITLIAVFSFFLFACSNDNNVGNETDEQTANQLSQEMNNDTAIVVRQEFPEELHDFEADFKKISLPFTIKYNQIDSNKQEKLLTLEQLDYLSANFINIEKQEDYYVKESKRIYKLKKNGKYDDYVALLDLANLKDATAHPFGQIDLDSARIVLWTISYNSYEACPFYSGIELMMSWIQHDSVQKSLMLGTEMQGGDPPGFGEIMTAIELTNDLQLHRTVKSNTFEDEELIDESVSDTIINILH